MIQEERRSEEERQPRCQHPRHKRSLERCLGWLFLTMLVSNMNSSHAALENRTDTGNGKSGSGTGLISPRMDYEEWTPLGRGDPLKNNPTFDYVPPVLDNVQYWLDSQTTEASASAKRDILVLGVTARKANAKIPGRHFNLVDGIDGYLTSTAKQQTKSTEQHLLQRRADFTGSTGAEPPNILRSSTFKHKLVSPPGEYSNNPRKIQREPTPSYYPSPYYVGQHGGKLHTTTRLLADSHQLSQPTKAESSHQPHLSKFPSVFRFEESERSPSHKGYGSLKATTFSKDRVRPTISVTDVGAVRFQIPGGESNKANEGKFGELSFRGPVLPGKLAGILANSGVGPSKAVTPDTVTVEKSSLIYESSDTISGDWLGARSTLVPKPVDHRITRTQLPHHANHHQYDEDRDGSPSANHPVVIPHNGTVGKTGTNHHHHEYRPEMTNGDTLSAEYPAFANEGVASDASIDANVKSDNRSDHYSGHLPLDEWYNQQLTAAGQEHIKQLHTGAPMEEMHIIIANSDSNESRVIESEQTSTSSLAIVMPTNYSNKTLPAILKNIQLTTTTATPSEIRAHWSNSVDQLANLTATGTAQVSDSSSSSVSVPDTPKRVLVAPGAPAATPPLLQPHTRESQLPSMRDYPGRKHVFFPPKTPPYSLSEQLHLHPHAHPQRHSNPLTHLRPNSHANLFAPTGMYQRPQATMDSVKGHLPGTMTFLEGVHSTFSPQSASTVELASTHVPIKVRQPLAPTFMSMPIEMRVSMTMPMPGAAHFSATTAHTAYGMPSKKTWDQLLTKPEESDLDSQYAVVGSNTRSKSNPASPMFADNGGAVDEFNSMVNGSSAGSNHHKANYRPSEEEGPSKKGPGKLLANEEGSKEKGELGREAYPLDIERKPESLSDHVRSSINSLEAESTADQDEQQRVSESAQVQPKTTTVASLTTDPIFSHYKQPAKPIRGPMYLIIQGHSKVKTYKPNANKPTGAQEDRLEQQEKQSIAEGMRERKLSKFDRYVRVRENAIKAEKGVVNNATDEKPVLEGNLRKADNYLEQGTATLISLVESGLGQISASPLPVAARKKARGAGAGAGAGTGTTPSPCAPSASIFASRK